MTALRWLLIAVLPLGAAAALLWAFQAPPPRPNIILVTADTVRADHLSPYGYHRDTTPNLAELAASGVVFDNAFTQSSLSGPSHATMMTGLYPPSHGVLINAVDVPSDLPVLAEVLAGAGYHTAAIVNHKFVSGRYGFFRGFAEAELRHLPSHGPDHRHRDEYDDRLPPDSLFDAVFDWLDEPHPEPYFLWVHVQHPHKSYEPLGEYATRYMQPPESRYDLRCLDTLQHFRRERIHLSSEEVDYVVALYDGELAYVDDKLGGMLERLRERGQLERTIVAFTSDHGEMLFDPPRPRTAAHEYYHFDPVLRVPLVIAGPPVEAAGPRADAMVGLVDLAPTLVELAGVEPPAAWQGTSLRPLMATGQGTIRTENFATTGHKDGAADYSIRTDELKWYCRLYDDRDRKCRLFDLRRDPAEVDNLVDSPEHAGQQRRLEESLARWMAETLVAERVASGEPRNQEALELLRRAGYLDERDAAQ